MARDVGGRHRRSCGDNGVHSGSHSGDGPVDRLAVVRAGEYEDAIRVAFLPRQFVNAVPIGGASLIISRDNSAERQAAAWTLINWLTPAEIAGAWSRLAGYFAPRI
jgi:ABC-type glycerol-3-phosphate transport system substrate-binding protein